MELQKKAEAVRNSLDELAAILRRPMQYAMMDLTAWAERKLESTREIADELVTELDPEYPDAQRIYASELEQSAGEQIHG